MHMTKYGTFLLLSAPAGMMYMCVCRRFLFIRYLDELKLAISIILIMKFYKTKYKKFGKL